eukprot:13794059-Alexandrium_andersonii.AAC.1
MRAAIALWDQFATASGPPTNDSKTQRWARAPTASKELAASHDFQAVGKGVVLGEPQSTFRRLQAAKERERLEAIAATAFRIAALPGSNAFH